VETPEDKEPTSAAEESQNLQALSQLYRRQADHVITLSRLNASASLVFGAVTVAFVALLLFIPWTSLMNLLTTKVGM
jgi:type II secretory pathway component PulF